MDQPNILVIGSANADLITRVPRCPKPGESLIGSSFATLPGGKGANQAVAAARLGANARFSGCIGRDALGSVIVNSLREAGVDLSALKRHAEEPTGTAVIVVGEDGQNAIVVTPAANYGITPEDIEDMEDFFDEADVLLLQLEIPLDTVAAALLMAERKQVHAILDAGPAQAVPDHIIAKATVVSPNETEAEAMTGIAVTDLVTARAAAEALRAMGAKEVVLKLGNQGALYVGSQGERHAPAFPVTPLDTVAAGDAFTAALATKWGRTDIDEALRYANAAGALATLKAGAQPAMPTREEVDAFLHERNSGT